MPFAHTTHAPLSHGAHFPSYAVPVNNAWSNPMHIQPSIVSPHNEFSVFISTHTLICRPTLDIRGVLNCKLLELHRFITLFQTNNKGGASSNHKKKNQLERRAIILSFSV